MTASWRDYADDELIAALERRHIINASWLVQHRDESDVEETLDRFFDR